MAMACDYGPKPDEECTPALGWCTSDWSHCEEFPKLCDSKGKNCNWINYASEDKPYFEESGADKSFC